MHILGSESVDFAVYEGVRKQIERCECPSTFELNMASAGGSGSG